MSCRFALDDAAYVLGALPPQERREYEEHLADCSDCARAVQQVAGLPGLLSKVPLEDLTGEVPDPPDSLLPSLLASVHQGRHRRGLALAALGAAAAVLAVLALVGGLAGRTSNPPPEVVAAQLQPVGTVPIQASVRLAALPWGTGVALAAARTPPVTGRPRRPTRWSPSTGPVPCSTWRPGASRREARRT